MLRYTSKQMQACALTLALCTHIYSIYRLSCQTSHSCVDRIDLNVLGVQFTLKTDLIECSHI